MLDCSLNEIDALCRKAARGAGFGWGIAEDAGKAARWLEAMGQPGAVQLRHCLQACDSDRTGCLERPVPGEIWSAATGLLCPLIAGAALSDHAHILGDGPLRFGVLRHPILVAPYAAAASYRLQRAVSLEWSGARIVTLRDASLFEGAPKSLLCDMSQHVTCSVLDKVPPLTAPAKTRANPDRATYDQLNALAQRTYAPATEASRAAGAGGSGLTGNH